MKYTLQFKTGDAELRALRNIPTNIYSKFDFALLIELTRGRKSKKDNDGDLNKRIEALKTFLSPDAVVYFDITTDVNLSNYQIDELYDITDGYQNWQTLFTNLKSIYKNAIPMLLLNDIDTEYDNFKLQVETLAKAYKSVGYKIYPSVDQEIIKNELNIIVDLLQHIEGVKLTVFYDQGYIADGLVKVAETNAVDFFNLAHSILENYFVVEYVLTSTSFPDSVTSLSKSYAGTLKCSELSLYENVKKNIPLPISYSDY